MIDDEVVEDPVVDEITQLKARADLLGVTFHPSIGVDKLREKVAAKLSGEPQPVEVPVVAPFDRAAARRAANALVRIRVTCMNPLKKEWDGEIFTTGNAAVGTIRKYVPFEADDGYHVPQMLLTMLQERQCQVFTTVVNSLGNKVRRGKLIKEFAIEILPPLTEKQLADLARQQAMKGSVG